MEDPKRVLWELIRQLDAHGIYRTDLKPGSSTVEWASEIEADTGKVVTQPMVISSEALVWLEECRFTPPRGRSGQYSRLAGCQGRFPKLRDGADGVGYARQQAASPPCADAAFAARRISTLRLATRIADQPSRWRFYVSPALAPRAGISRRISGGYWG